MDGAALKDRRIAVGVGGGIAAYKACELVRALRRGGAQVRVAMTEAAQKFVTPLTFLSLSGHAVLTDYFDPTQEGTFGHLQLARWAELYVVAPATADLLARIRAGIANDAVTTSVLAFKGPVLLAPAMNVAMFENRITQENLKALLSEPRFRLVGPGVGELADGEVGPGRLSEVSNIVDAVAELASAGQLSGVKVLITTGPTREFLDPVRFISNPSTGKMGIALAQAARARGADVTVVAGPIEPLEANGLSLVRVTSAEEMAREVLSRVRGMDFFIAAAAVGDYRPKEFSTHKIKKSQTESKLILVPTPDVLEEVSKKVARLAKRPVLIGFAAETERVLENAQAKLMKKNLDAIVANDVSKPDAGFAADNNRVTFIPRKGPRQDLSGPKLEIAGQLWDLFMRCATSRAGKVGSAGR